MCSNNNSIHSQQQLLNWLIVLAVFMQQVHSTPMAKMVVSNNKDKGNTVTDMKTSAMPTMPSTTTVAAAATETKTATGTASASTRVRALKMLGPNPLAPGQKGTVKTAYFDPKTYSTKDLRDFHRLTQGLNADIRRMVEETEQIRQSALHDSEELSRLRDWARADNARQWLLLLTMGCVMAVAVLLMAMANLLLVRMALNKTKTLWKCSSAGMAASSSSSSFGKATLLVEDNDASDV